MKATLNEMSLLMHKMAEKQGIDLKDARNKYFVTRVLI